MGTRTLVSVEEYLHTVYRPDCDYVDGVVEERNLGEIDHSYLQAALLFFLMSLRKTTPMWVFPEQRVQVAPTRFRVPDISVVLSWPEGRIIRTPPFLCIEILSPEDRASRTNIRIQDYLAFGVPYVWVIDPETRQGWIYTAEGMRPAKDGVLRTADPEIAVPLATLFEGRPA